MICRICKRPLDIPGYELSGDCGGDCWGCMRAIEEAIPDPRPPANDHQTIAPPQQ
jgi:hypothetical protein